MVLRGGRLLTEANRLISSPSVLGSAEMSAPVTPAAPGRAGMRCVTESGGRGARLRSVQREGHLLPGRGGGERTTERIQYTPLPLIL